MKTKLALLALFAFSTLAYCQSATNVRKSADTATINALIGDLVLPSGGKITIASGATLEALAGSTLTGFGGGGGGGALNDLSDVTITTAATNDFIVKSAGNWVNLTPTNARTALGLGTLATQSATISDYLTSATAASSYQPLSSTLTTLAAGALPIANGGTGQTTASAARIALLPSMAANGGKFLRVNAGATDYELATISGGGDALVANPLSQFAATTSAQLRGVLSDESGTGEILTTNGSAASLTSFPTLNQNTTGSAATLTTPRTINGTAFDGSANITVTAAASTLTGLGTGVATAITTNVGSAGSVVVNGGDGGTPSSITLTNASGTAASLTAGTATVAEGMKTATTTVVVSGATAPTTGQVLTATSASAANWQTPSGGGGAANWTLISTTTLSANSSVTLAIDGYRRYQIEFESVLCSLDGYPLQLQVSTDAGSTWHTGASDYDWGASKIGAYTDASGTGAFIRLAPLTGNGTGEGVTGVLDVIGANDSGLQFRIFGKLMEPAYNSASVYGWDIVGRRAANNDVDAVKIYFSSGTLLSGKIRVFGWSE